MQDAAKEHGYELILTLADSPDHERNGVQTFAGRSDYEIAAETTPGLTTIEPHAEMMGRVAVSMIVERIDGACETGSVRDTGFRIVPRASA